MNKPTTLIYTFITILILVLSTSTFALILNDNGRISSTNVSYVVHVKTERDIQKAIRDAAIAHIPICMMGKQHSQGGQSLASRAIALDMLGFNKILKLDMAKKQVTVESGITWSDLQKYINRYNLAITSMQSPNIFTVGGSVSVNAHGDDFRAGAVGNSIVAFHIILANGKKLFITADTYPDLWKAVIGGYGLFGVITDVTLQLTDNVLLASHYVETDLTKFSNYFRTNILNSNNAVLFYAHLNIVPGADFLKNMYVITYTNTHTLPHKIIKLDNPDKWNVILRPTFDFSRVGNLGKSWRYNFEKKVFSKYYQDRIVSRNNAMEKPVSFASDYHGKNDADWLQEYFIPINHLAEFIASLRKVMMQNNVNLLNVTIRFVPAEKNLILNYANTDRFAVVLYFNQHLNQSELNKTKVWTRELIDAAIDLNGSYYLPYQPFAEKKQFEKCYPNYKKIIELKKVYDKGNLFNNQFYLDYF